MQEILSKKLLGQRIKSLRLENGYGQAQIAEILQLSRSNYSQIELGYQYPTFHTLILVSKHYRKSYEWLLHGKDELTTLPKNGVYSGILVELDMTLKQISNSLRKLENELQHIKSQTAIS